MKHLLQMAIVASIGVTLASATTTQAAPVTVQSDPQQIVEAQRLHSRWLAQFGSNPRIQPLCGGPYSQGGQMLSTAGCTALARLREADDGSSVTTIRRYQLRRNRPVWSAIPWRDKRVLVEYDVLVLGNEIETSKAIAPAK
jgi:hypothetical protein